MVEARAKGAKTFGQYARAMRLFRQSEDLLENFNKHLDIVAP